LSRVLASRPGWCLPGFAPGRHAKNGRVGAVRLRVRAELRRRWAAWLALAALVGVFAGGVIAVSAGATRTNTAYPRLLAATRAPDVLVVDHLADPSFASFSPGWLAGLPQVSESGQLDSFVVLHPSDLNVLASPDNIIGNRFYTKKLLAGRLPDRARPDEVAVSFRVAEVHHVRVGAVLSLQMQPATGSKPVSVRLRVVGVDAAAAEFPPEAAPAVDTVWATPAFVRRYGPVLATTPNTLLRLTHGAADLPAVQSEMNRMAAGKPAEAFLLATQGANTERSIHLQSVALWVLASLLALAGILIVAQLLARQSALESVGYRELRALGMTGKELWGVGLARVGLIGLVAAVVAGITAAAASPVFPLGLARIAEPHPGFHFDAAAVLVGMVTTFLAVMACGTWPAWRSARVAAPLERTSRVERRRPGTGALIQRVGVPVSAATGIGFALGRARGRFAVPVRSTITAAVMGVAALSAAVVFSASLTHLMNTPTLYGDTWDALVTSLQGEGSSPTTALPALQRDRDIVAISVGYAAVPMQINGAGVAGLAVDTVKGPLLAPAPVQGRAPSNPGEMLLGSRDMQRLHLHLGDLVHLSVVGLPVPRPVRVVGTAIFPYLGDQLGLGRGVSAPVETLKAAVRGATPPPDTILVRFRSGTDRAAALARIDQELGPLTSISVAPPDPPADLINFGRVEQLPLAVGSLLGLLALGTLVHLLVTSIRRRRGDLAVLKVLGFVPGQVRRTVVWQASTIAAIALAFGVPLGVVLGRLIWFVFANELGVVAAPMVPPLRLIALVIGGLVVAGVVAAGPAWSASRTRAGSTLRAA
jgi:MacB-like periplasmic core domain/FtsX-like permease family